MANSNQRVEEHTIELDIQKRFVRVVGERSDGFVEFEFAIGEPDMYVEMILNHNGFIEFCIENKVELLPTYAITEDEVSDWDWRLSDATRVRFK